MKKLLSPPDEFMKMNNSSIKNILLNWRDADSIMNRKRLEVEVEVEVLICIIIIVAKIYCSRCGVKKVGILCKNATYKSNANQQPTGHPGHLPPLTTSPVSSSVNFKAHGNIISVSTAIVRELSVARLAQVQGQIAQYNQNKIDGKTHVQVRPSQDWNNTSSGLVATAQIIAQDKTVRR